MEPLPEKNRPSPLQISCADSTFQYVVTQAICVLLHNLDEHLKEKMPKWILCHETMKYFAQIIKLYHKNLYELYLQLPASFQTKKYKKLHHMDYKKLSDEPYDQDFTNMFKILKTIIQKQWHVPIINQFANGFDITKYHIDIDEISLNIIITKRE